MQSASFYVPPFLMAAQPYGKRERQFGLGSHGKVRNNEHATSLVWRAFKARQMQYHHHHHTVHYVERQASHFCMRSWTGKSHVTVNRVTSTWSSLCSEVSEMDSPFLHPTLIFIYSIVSREDLPLLCQQAQTLSTLQTPFFIILLHVLFLARY